MILLRSSLTLFASLLSFIGFAETYIFSGSGNWKDPSNWKNRLVPQPGTISDITITGNAVYSSGLTLASGSTLIITSGATLTLKADVLNCHCGDGGLWFQGATINVQSGATFNCIDWIYSYGTLNVDGVMTCSNVVSDMFTTTTINGRLEIGKANTFAMFRGPIIVNSAGTLVVKPGTILSSASDITVYSGGTLTNEGTIKGKTVFK